MRDTRVLLLTDVVDSTQVTESLGDERASKLWAEHDRVVRQLVRETGGREIDKSDGFLLLFDDVPSAVGCGLELHRLLAQLEPPLSARVGIHRTPVLTRETSAHERALGAKPLEVDGIGKAVAARIMALARGGQTLISAEARDDLGSDHGWRSVSHGFWRLKGCAQPVELYEVALRDAPVLPPSDSPKAYRVVSTGGHWRPCSELRHGLPAERDGFVGRHGALDALAARIEGARLVTVLGIGGIGKTRLALRFARDWLGDFPGGAWFCDLSSARTLDGIVHATAQGLDVPLGKSDPVEQIGLAVAGRGRCLVILDNFEQVTRHAEQTLGRWLEQAGQALFLVTSREVLGIAGEQTFVLSPLEADEAVHLFESRAIAAAPAGASGVTDQAATLRLVELLDRLPLAIELAAARVRLLTIDEMVDRMGERFKVLASVKGARHDRQATMRAALDWSWDLLSPIEQVVLGQLSVFEGGFTLSAAEAVVSLTEDPSAPWLGDVLQALIEKSLLARLTARRFGFLRTVLDYLRQRCEAPSTTDQGVAAAARSATTRHAMYYSALDEAAATADRCAEVDNLVLACRRSLPGAPALAAAATVNLWAALRMSGPLRAIVPVLESVSSAVPSVSAERARLRGIAAGMLHQAGNLAQALQEAGEGLRLSFEIGSESTQARLAITMADVLRSLGRLREAQDHASRALALAERGTDMLTTLEALNSLGALHQIKGDHGEAARLYHHALRLARDIQHPRWTGGLLGNLAVIARQAGRTDEALRHFQEALSLAEAIGDRQWEGNNRSNLALLLHDLGQHREAEQQLLRALSIARDIGHGKIERFVLCNLGIVYEALGEAEAARANLEASVALCVGSGDRHSESTFRGYLGLHLARTGYGERSATEFNAALATMRLMESPSALRLLMAQAALAAVLCGDSARGHLLAREVDAALAGTAEGSSLECRALLNEMRAAGAAIGE